MRHETLGKLSFDSHYLGRLIDVFLTTHIASDFERCGDRGARSDGVGLGEEDFVLVDEVARDVVDVILAVTAQQYELFSHIQPPLDCVGWLEASRIAAILIPTR